MSRRKSADKPRSGGFGKNALNLFDPVYPQTFHSTRLFSHMFFFNKKICEIRQISRIFQFWLILIGGWKLRVYWSKVFWTFYNRVFFLLNTPVPLEIFGSLISKNEQNSTNSRKFDRVFKWLPPIFVYENDHRYQCLALCKLVWMYSVDFFILHLLKRYRPNTAETRPLAWSLISLSLSLSTNFQLVNTLSAKLPIGKYTRLFELICTVGYI